uniref:Uncharacterized protein n=1 Tax=Physcomitrium patens TaxID=3218 RepID=A0A2K1KG52_PHYPA|nr:hypothetical protein PHYPA_009127 [Physcomitrium patens]
MKLWQYGQHKSQGPHQVQVKGGRLWCEQLTEVDHVMSRRYA